MLQRILPWDQGQGHDRANAAQADVIAPNQGKHTNQSRPRRRLTFARWKHRIRRRWRETRILARIVGSELLRTKVLDIAGGLAFWSMMSMVPLLMTMVGLISILHLPNLVPQLLSVLALLVPASALAMVESMIGKLLTPHEGAFSFGLLSYIWSATGGFTSLIAALNIAYDVTAERSWIRQRIQALVLTFTSGGLLTISLIALIVGPDFAHFMAQIVPIPPSIERLWPFIRFGVVFVSFVLGLELVYFLGPNMRQRFKSTLPGAILATFLWFAGSFGLGFYLTHLSNFSKLYGGMGAVLALMFWIYLTALAILIGAETNAELAKRMDTLVRGDLRSTRKARAALEAQKPQGKPVPGRPAA